MENGCWVEKIQLLAGIGGLILLLFSVETEVGLKSLQTLIRTDCARSKSYSVRKPVSQFKSSACQSCKHSFPSNRQGRSAVEQ